MLSMALVPTSHFRGYIKNIRAGDIHTFTLNVLDPDTGINNAINSCLVRNSQGSVVPNAISGPRDG